MRFFKRKKNDESPAPGVTCPNCGSAATFPSVPHGGDAARSVKSWRGERFLEWRCRDCGRSFYADAPDPEDGAAGEDIDDEEELRLADEDLKRLTDEEGDHRFPSH